MPQKSTLTSVLLASRKQMPMLLVLSFLSNLLLLTTSVYMLQVFDRVLSSGSVDTLIWLTVITVVALVTYGFLEYARRIVLTRTGSWIEGTLAPAVLQRTIRARLSSGQSVARMGDVSDIKGFLASDAVLAALDAPWSPIFIAVIWAMSPLLGMVAVVGAVLLFLIAVLNDVLTRRRQSLAASQLRAARDDAERFVENAETLAGLGMIGAVTQLWQERRDKAEEDSARATEGTTAFFGVSRVLRLVLQVAILGAGAWLVLGAELTAGGMIAASIILARALSPVERSIVAWKSYGSYRLALGRLQRLFEAAPDAAPRLALPKPAGRLRVQDLRFNAFDSHEPVLRGVTFQLEPGEVCAIIGPSGSGKTTLCKLLVGAWRASFGEVRLDGAEIAEWEAESLGKHIGYLPQSVELFSGTVARNIARMAPVEDAAVLAAAQAAGVHDMILSLPGGYETEVGPHGDHLSAGQQQRVGFARALYGDPSLIVLDEPNSNLDGNGEIALIQALKALKSRGKTIIFVSHLPNILRVADKVLVIRKGAVAGFGPRDHVLSELQMVARVVPEAEAETAAMPAHPDMASVFKAIHTVKQARDSAAQAEPDPPPPDEAAPGRAEKRARARSKAESAAGMGKPHKTRKQG